MRLTKRQLKRIIREEYRRHKRLLVEGPAVEGGEVHIKMEMYTSGVKGRADGKITTAEGALKVNASASAGPGQGGRLRSELENKIVEDLVGKLKKDETKKFIEDFGLRGVEWTQESTWKG